MDPRAPFVEVFERHLRRRRLATGLEGARRGGGRALVLALILLGLVALGVLPPPGSPLTAAFLFLGFLALGTLLGATRNLVEQGTAPALARTLDGALGSTDLVATARALASRPGAPTGFGLAVLDRATAEVEALAPDRVGRLPRPPWRLLGLALLAAVLLALLPKGGLGLLPGLGVGWGAGGRATPEGAHFGPAKEHAEGDPVERPEAEEGENPATPPEKPEVEREEEPEKPPPPEKPREEARLELAPLARTHPPAAPVTMGAVAEGGPGARDGVPLDLAVSVDDSDPVPLRDPFPLPEGRREVRTFDLRSLPGLLPKLGPGKHRVRGELRDGQGRTVAVSPEVEIEIEGGEDGAGKGGTPPKKPDPGPSAPPEPPPSDSAAPAPSLPPPSPPAVPPPAPGEPEPEIPLPPSALDRKRVQPLFGSGEEILKKGPILILDPEGGRGDPAREAAPEEVLSELRARVERAARREGVDPGDVDTIRRYFEALRRILEGGK